MCIKLHSSPRLLSAAQNHTCTCKKEYCCTLTRVPPPPTTLPKSQLATLSIQTMRHATYTVSPNGKKCVVYTSQSAQYIKIIPLWHTFDTQSSIQPSIYIFSITYQCSHICRRRVVSIRDCVVAPAVANTSHLLRQRACARVRVDRCKPYKYLRPRSRRRLDIECKLNWLFSSRINISRFSVLRADCVSRRLACRRLYTKPVDTHTHTQKRGQTCGSYCLNTAQIGTTRLAV